MRKRRSMLDSSNPALQNENVWQSGFVAGDTVTASVQGVVNKTSMLAALAVGGGIFGIWLTQTYPGLSWPLGILGFIAIIVVYFVIMANPMRAKQTAWIYAVVEGAFLGVLTCFIDMMYPGIATQAIMITFSILFSMLFLYRSGYIKVTEKFKAGLFAAIMGIMIVYMTSWILSWFNIYIGAVYGGGWFAIGFSLFVCVIASLFFVVILNT